MAVEFDKSGVFDGNVSREIIGTATTAALLQAEKLCINNLILDAPVTTATTADTATTPATADARTMPDESSASKRLLTKVRAP